MVTTHSILTGYVTVEYWGLGSDPNHAVRFKTFKTEDGYLLTLAEHVQKTEYDWYKPVYNGQVLSVKSDRVSRGFKKDIEQFHINNIEQLKQKQWEL